MKSANLHFYLPQEDRVEIKLFKLNGSLVTILYNGILQKGDQNFSLPMGGTAGQDIPSGMYLVKIDGKHFWGAKTVIKI
jgi:hypothetical protein